MISNTTLLWLSLLLLCGGQAQAGIRKGFNKDIPSNDELKEIKRRILVSEPQYNRTDSPGDSGVQQPPPGSCKGSKKSSKLCGGGKGNGFMGDVATVELPDTGGAPDEINFFIVMDEYAYSGPLSIGTKFAFSGRIATDEATLGKSSGTCTVASDNRTEFTCCDFYLAFDTGIGGVGTVTLSGNTDDIGGWMQVTGTADDFASSNQGYATLLFDPAGNPIIYTLLTLH